MLFKMKELNDTIVLFIDRPKKNLHASHKNTSPFFVIYYGHQISYINTVLPHKIPNRYNLQWRRKKIVSKCAECM